MYVVIIAADEMQENFRHIDHVLFRTAHQVRHLHQVTQTGVRISRRTTLQTRATRISRSRLATKRRRASVDRYTSIYRWYTQHSKLIQSYVTFQIDLLIQLNNNLVSARHNTDQSTLLVGQNRFKSCGYDSKQQIRLGGTRCFLNNNRFICWR